MKPQMSDLKYLHSFSKPTRMSTRLPCSGGAWDGATLPGPTGTLGAGCVGTGQASHKDRLWETSRWMASQHCWRRRNTAPVDSSGSTVITGRLQPPEPEKHPRTWAEKALGGPSPVLCITQGKEALRGGCPGMAGAEKTL